MKKKIKLIFKVWIWKFLTIFLKYFNITHSKWIYNIYKKRFETKEKRNNHRKKIYYQKTLIDIDDWEIKCSENEKFICKYERNYIWAWFLQYYQKSYKKKILSNEIVDDQSVEKDVYQIFYQWNCWCQKLKNR